MLNIYYGTSGTDKTNKIVNLIKDDLSAHKRVYLIVPEQQMLLTERKMLSALDPSSQLSFQVLSFSRLANIVFRKYGGLSYNYVSNASKSIIMWFALKEAATSLQEYPINAYEDQSFVSMMLSTVSELKSYTVAPQDFSEFSLSLEKGTKARRKFSDLALVYSLYESMLAEKFDDSSDDLSKLVQVLKDNPFFDNSTVYIDSFDGFTAQEYQVIRKILALADNVSVTLNIASPKSECRHLSIIKDTIGNLRKICSDVLGLDSLREYAIKSSFSTRTYELELLEKNLWSYKLPNSEEMPDEQMRGSVESYICHDPYSEAEMIANKIISMTIDGYRYKDIAIIFRDAGARSGIIDSVLEKHGIPYFMSCSTDITSKPLIKLMLSALRVYIYSYKADDVISFLKTGLCDLEAMDINLFEEYCTTWDIKGKKFMSEWTMNPDGYKSEISDRSRAILEKANKVRAHLVELFKTFSNQLSDAETVSDCCRAIFSLLNAVNATDKLNALAIKESSLGLARDADETLQLYNAILKLFADINSACGNARITAKDFYLLFKCALNSVEIGAIPTSSDQVVIGSADRLRLSDIKCAFISGLSEGEFPRAISESPIITDTERKELLEFGIELYKNDDVRRSEELLYFYKSICVPTERLILSYPQCSESGSPNNPSLALKQVTDILPYIRTINYDKLSPKERFYSVISAFERTNEYKSHNEADTVIAALEECDSVAPLLHSVDKSVSAQDQFLRQDTVDRLHRQRLYLTNTSIELYMGCRLDYYCKSILQLRGHKKAMFFSNNVGLLVHYVLENALLYLKAKLYLQDKDGLNNLSEDELDDIIRITVNKYIEESFSEYYIESSRIRHLIDKLTRLAKLILNNIVEELRNGEFLPEFFELKISAGADDRPSTLKYDLDTDQTINVGGIADRVDIYRKGKDIYVRVVDYKTSGKDFTLADIEKGNNLQALIYLRAICKSQKPGWLKRLGADEGHSVLPASAVYLSSEFKPIAIEEDTPYSLDQTLAKASASISKKGIVVHDETVLNALTRAVEKGFEAASKIQKGKLGGVTVVSDEQLTYLFDKLDEVIKRIGNDIYSGNASPKAFSDNSYPNIKKCQSCPFINVCRQDRNEKGEDTDEP